MITGAPLANINIVPVLLMVPIYFVKVTDVAVLVIDPTVCGTQPVPVTYANRTGSTTKPVISPTFHPKVNVVPVPAVLANVFEIVQVLFITLFIAAPVVPEAKTASETLTE